MPAATGPPCRGTAALSRRAPALDAAPRTTFDVRSHQVCVWLDGRRWHVSIDGSELPIWFVTAADAWAAGVQEADRLDRVAA